MEKSKDTIAKRLIRQALIYPILVSMIKDCIDGLEESNYMHGYYTKRINDIEALVHDDEASCRAPRTYRDCYACESRRSLGEKYAPRYLNSFRINVACLVMGIFSTLWALWEKDALICIPFVVLPIVAALMSGITYKDYERCKEQSESDY